MAMTAVRKLMAIIMMTAQREALAAVRLLQRHGAGATSSNRSALVSRHQDELGFGGVPARLNISSSRTACSSWIERVEPSGCCSGAAVRRLRCTMSTLACVLLKG